MNVRGFTLIEILVALTIMALTFAIIIRPSFNSRNDLDETLANLEAAIRFAMDESSMRNAVVRLHFKWEESNASYNVQYGPSDNFILPAKTKELVTSKEEDEKAKKKEDSVNARFHKIREFEDGDKKFPHNVHLIGVGTKSTGKLSTFAETSIYIFSTGEKDGAFIALGTDEEIAVLKMDEASSNMIRDYQKLDASDVRDTDELIGIQNKVAQDLFEKWLKE